MVLLKTILDPLTASEINHVRNIVLKSKLGHHKNISFQYMAMEAPEKKAVYEWKNGSSPVPPRKTTVIARIPGETHQILVDITSNSLVYDKVYNGSGYPIFTIEEQVKAITLAMEYPPFTESIKNRGLDMKSVVCNTLSAGWFGEKKGKRKINIQCFYTNGTVNIDARPIEGVTAIVGLDEMKIIGYMDRLKVPIPKAQGTDYRQSSQKPPFGPKTNPISMEQPEGPSFRVHGHMMEWANWKFHVGFDMRAGPIISTADVYDYEKGRFRSVMYRGFVSELFVPYMDPSQEWYFKTYFDEGDYGLGIFSVTLQPLNDCPRYAHYMDAVYAGGDGKAVVKENVFCVFERYAGDVSWRHTESSIPDLVVWVSQYNQTEQWAGGVYMDQSHGDDTLSTWTNKNRDIENKDIVLWHTIGIHHISYQEDFPVMPTLSEGFELKPTNFFERNPILKLEPMNTSSFPKCIKYG